MKENRKKILDFTLVILIPMIPVIIFYVLFNKYNYFELEDNVKGIVAGGPIAAYVFLLASSWYIYKGISTRQSLNKNLRFLIGNWKVISKSTKSNTEYNGNMKIMANEGSIIFNGNFYVDKELVATVSTIIASVIDSTTIHLVYKIEDQKRKNQSVTGYSNLKIISKNELEGLWSVMGSEEYGKAKYTKES